MTDPQDIWGALVLASAVASIPFVFHLCKRKPDMTVSSTAQALVDELNAAVATLSTALSNADATATAQSAEDLAAIKTAADALVSAINTAAPPPAPPAA